MKARYYRWHKNTKVRNEGTQDAKCDIQLTTIQKEDRGTDEGRLVKATFELCKVATNNRSQNEAHTGGCIEAPHY